MKTTANFHSYTMHLCK